MRLIVDTSVGSVVIGSPPHDGAVWRSVCLGTAVDAMEKTKGTRSHGGKPHIPGFPRSTTVKARILREKKKPCPRRMAQEGFMATPAHRHEQTAISVNPRSRRQHHRLEQTMEERSGPSRVFPAWWGAPGDAGRLRVGTGGAQAAHRGDGWCSRCPMPIARSDIEVA